MEGQTDGPKCKPIVPFGVNTGRGLVSYSYMGLEARKPVLGGLGTTKAQTSLGILAV